MTTYNAIGEFVTLTNTLPFSMNQTSFCNWFDSLDKGKKVETLDILYSTLKVLNGIEIKPEARFFFVQKISILVYALSQQLFVTYKLSHFPFSKQDKLKVMLSISCAKELSANYLLLCEWEGFELSDTFTLQQKSLILYSAINALAHTLFYKAVLYEKVDKKFWKSCYLLYLFAKQNDTLLVAIDSRESCFLNVFKQVLLFELGGPQQFNTEELATIFYFLQNDARRIDLLAEAPEGKIKDIPYINLREDNPPLFPKSDQLMETQSYLVYISSSTFIKQVLNLLADVTVVKKFNKPTLMRLIKTLAINQQRKSDRELIEGSLHVVVSLEQILAFIIEKEKKALNDFQGGAGELESLNFELMQKSGKSQNLRSSDGFNFRSELRANFAITFEDDLDGIDTVNSDDIWASEEKNKDVIEAVSNAEFVDQSPSGFRLRVKDNNTAIIVGDLVALSIKEILIVTVVRRIIHISEDEMQVGLEVLGNFDNILHVINTESNRGISVLHLKSRGQGESIIIKSENYHREAFLFADNNEVITKYVVEKQLNSTPHFFHLKVSLA